MQWMRHFSYRPHHVTPWLSLEISEFNNCSHSHYHHLHHIESSMSSSTTGILLHLAIFHRSLKFLDSLLFLSFTTYLILSCSSSLPKLPLNLKTWCMNTSGNRPHHLDLIQKFTGAEIYSYAIRLGKKIHSLTSHEPFLIFLNYLKLSHFSLSS